MFFDEFYYAQNLSVCVCDIFIQYMSVHSNKSIRFVEYCILIAILILYVSISSIFHSETNPNNSFYLIIDAYRILMFI